MARLSLDDYCHVLCALYLPEIVQEIKGAGFEWRRCRPSELQRVCEVCKQNDGVTKVCG